MGAPSVFTTASLQTVDGVVVGPAWTDDRGRELLRYLRSQRPAAPDYPDGDEYDSDVSIASRVFHEVLALHPAAERWPVFAGRSSRSSLFKAAVTHAHDPADLTALARLSDASALIAANIARWLLQLPQQTSATMVFVSPPSPPVPPPPRRSSYSTAREVAAASA